MTRKIKSQGKESTNNKTPRKPNEGTNHKFFWSSTNTARLSKYISKKKIRKQALKKNEAFKIKCHLGVIFASPVLMLASTCSRSGVYSSIFKYVQLLSIF